MRAIITAIYSIILAGLSQFAIAATNETIQLICYVSATQSIGNVENTTVDFPITVAIEPIVSKSGVILGHMGQIDINGKLNAILEVVKITDTHIYMTGVLDKNGKAWELLKDGDGWVQDYRDVIIDRITGTINYRVEGTVKREGVGDFVHFLRGSCTKYAASKRKF